jgi:hypothetical protein
MTDIVERAREYARNLGGDPQDYLVSQLADEIDRYGLALMMISEGCADPKGVARRALEPKP